MVGVFFQISHTSKPIQTSVSWGPGKIQWTWKEVDSWGCICLAVFYEYWNGVTPHLDEYEGLFSTVNLDEWQNTFFQDGATTNNATPFSRWSHTKQRWETQLLFQDGAPPNLDEWQNHRLKMGPRQT